jgi:hypothetical protein
VRREEDIGSDVMEHLSMSVSLQDVQVRFAPVRWPNEQIKSLADHTRRIVAYGQDALYLGMQPDEIADDLNVEFGWMATFKCDLVRVQERALLTIMADGSILS